MRPSSSEWPRAHKAKRTGPCSRPGVVALLLALPVLLWCGRACFWLRFMHVFCSQPDVNRTRMMVLLRPSSPAPSSIQDMKVRVAWDIGQQRTDFP